MRKIMVLVCATILVSGCTVIENTRAECEFWNETNYAKKYDCEELKEIIELDLPVFIGEVKNHHKCHKNGEFYRAGVSYDTIEPNEEYLERCFDE